MLGKILKKDGRLYFSEGKIQVKLVDEMNLKIAPYIGKDIILGIRSEDIYDKLFVSEAPPENVVRVNCEVVEPMGSEVYLHLNTGKHTFIARVGAHNRPKVNADIDMVFDMSKVHFFEQNTEETIV
jgi:multiple sugar transport system ATP-binding protein